MAFVSRAAGVNRMLESSPPVFFQAEDGIRDIGVTGVQTCALPISIFPVPAFGLKLLFGEMSEVLLASQSVLPAAPEAAGFKFRFPELGGALQDLLGR